MKTFLIKSLVTASILTTPMLFSGGCTREVAHTETDKPNLLGGSTHEEKTVYQNPDGSYTTQSEKHKTN
jgi:hypothetical protein